jgi:hypothetical protein
MNYTWFPIYMLLGISLLYGYSILHQTIITSVTYHPTAAILDLGGATALVGPITVTYKVVICLGLGLVIWAIRQSSRGKPSIQAWLPLLYYIFSITVLSFLAAVFVSG